MREICSIAQEKFIFACVVTLVNRNEIPSAKQLCRSLQTGHYQPQAANRNNET